MKKIVSTLLAVVLLITSVNMNTNSSQAATALKVSTNRISLMVGKTKVVTANKKVAWSSSNKKIATVKKINNKKAKIKAAKSGTCKIIAKYGKKKKTIQVTVKKKISNKVVVSPTPVVTDSSTVTSPTVVATEKTTVASPTVEATEKPTVTSPTVAATENPAVTLPTVAVTENPAVASPTVEATEKPTVTSPTVQVTENPTDTSNTATPDVSVFPTITATPTTDIYTGTIAHITVTAVSSSATGARIEIRNDNNTEVTYGEAYQLQKFESESWKNVEPIAENMAFPAVEIGLPSNTTGYIDVDWNDNYGKLEKGQYRIIKEYSIDGVVYKIAVPFQLQDNEKQFNFRNEDLLDSHYNKHCSEFGNITKEEYLEGANRLLNSTSDDILTRTRENGDIIYYNPNTNEFAIKSGDGYIRTYFKPSDGIDYFYRA